MNKMKRCLPLLLALAIVLTGSCTDSEETAPPTNLPETEIDQAKGMVPDQGTIKLRDECSTVSYRSVLEENTSLHTDAYTLTITHQASKRTAVHTLDLPPGRANIHQCNETQTVIGYPCGGPCYALMVVFSKENRPVERYFYAQPIGSAPHLLAHIANEQFDSLIVHNFRNSKEMKIDIADGLGFNYGHMDTLYLKKNELCLEYHFRKPGQESEQKVRKIANLSGIL